MAVWQSHIMVLTVVGSIYCLTEGTTYGSRAPFTATIIAAVVGTLLWDFGQMAPALAIEWD